MRINVGGLATSGVLVLTLGLLGGCSSSDSSASPDAATSVAQSSAASVAAAGVQRVDSAAFADAIAKPGVVLLDVRTPDEYAAGHIEGAINLDVEGADFASKVPELDPQATYAVYCRSGNRSQTAVAAMTEAGISNIYELQSGITDWVNSGNPIVQ